MLSFAERKKLKHQRNWHNYASVEMLAELWGLSKRRIQQLLKPLIIDESVEVVIGVFDSGTPSPFARPLYRRVK